MCKLRICIQIVVVFLFFASFSYSQELGKDILDLENIDLTFKVRQFYISTIESQEVLQKKYYNDSLTEDERLEWLYSNSIQIENVIDNQDLDNFIGIQYNMASWSSSDSLAFFDKVYFSKIEMMSDFKNDLMVLSSENESEDNHNTKELIASLQQKYGDPKITEDDFFGKFYRYTWVLSDRILQVVSKYNNNKNVLSIVIGGDKIIDSEKPKGSIATKFFIVNKKHKDKIRNQLSSGNWLFLKLEGVVDEDPENQQQNIIRDSLEENLTLEERREILAQKFASIEDGFIDGGFLDDKTAKSYMNMYIEFLSYKYSEDRRIIMRHLLDFHFQDKEIMDDKNKKVFEVYISNSNWDSINKPMLRINEAAYFGDANNEDEAYINEYIKNPEKFLRNRLKQEWFKGDKIKLMYMFFYSILQNYYGGDMMLEYWVKRYQVYGDALLDPDFKENNEVEEVEKEEGNIEIDEPEIIEVIETTDDNFEDEVMEIEIIEEVEVDTPEN